MAEYTQTYWNELMDKYRKGTISADERYQLEKQALDDPFLFDALEGFSLYDNAGEVEEKENRKAKIFTFPRLAIAASLVFLIAVMFNLYTDNNSPQESKDAIAMVLEPEAEREAENEKTSSTVDSEIASSTPVRKKDESGRSNAEKNIPSKPEEKKESVKRKASTKNDNTTQNTPIESKPSKDYANEDKKEMDVTAVESRPAAGGAIEDEKPEITADMPAAKDESSDQVVEEVVVVSDASSFDAQVTKEEAEKINVLSEPNAGAEQAKKKKSKSNGLTYFEAVPVIGKKIFDEYAKERIDKRGLRQAKPQEVTIEFTIDKNGNLTDFHHIYTGCPECGPFAISILQNSGEWKTVPPGFSGKARYTFIF